jgi:hypothetical protein
MSVKRRLVGALALGVAGILAAEATHAQLPALPRAESLSELSAAVEAGGSIFPRDSIVPSPPPHPTETSPALLERLGPPPRMVGGPERQCVEVPKERGITARSGEFIIGGWLHGLVSGRPMKIWYKPLPSSMDTELTVRGRLLGAASDTLRFESDNVVAPLHSETLEPYEDEAFFPSGTEFPTPGTWLLVATSGRSWGCFKLSVEAPTRHLEVRDLTRLVYRLSSPHEHQEE